MEQALLTLDNLSKYYVNGQNVVTGLHKVSLSFRRGEFVAITGESGSGKSTLAHILSGILPYEDGELYFDGKPTSHYDSADWEHYRRDNVAFISQNYGILPGATVEANVVSALRLAGMTEAQAKAEAEAILTKVELLEFRRRRAAKLSSGQKQRLSIARALAKPCPILIADEPTGNLDPENSEKVIQLLAKAAQDRLVILITHEFSEAEDYVTRHIRIQDGRVSADAPLRPASPAPAPEKHRTQPKELSPYIAGLQLRSRPVWSAMVLLFFTLTAFSVFVFLGSFIVALDDTSTRLYQTDAFYNSSRDRIVVVRQDGGSMTQEDYKAILSAKYVEKLERYGYICDTRYAYREGVDYYIHYSQKNYGSSADPKYMQVSYIEVADSGQYVQTVPLYAGNTEFLRSGRLPENFYEVVLAGSGNMLGQQITVYLQNPKNWAETAYIKLDVTVVGTTSQGDGIYFHDDVARVLTLDFLDVKMSLDSLRINVIPMPQYADVPSEVYYGNYISAEEAARAAANGDVANPFLTVTTPTEWSEMRPLGDTELLLSFDAYVRLRHNYISYGGTWSLYETYLDGTIFNVLGLHDSTLQGLVSVNPELFRTFVDENLPDCGDQVSITIQDYAYSQRVIDQLETMGYYALSPLTVGSTTIDEELAAQQMQTLVICFCALAAVVLLQLTVLRTLFRMEHESYRILSNIGLTYRTARSSIILQVLVFTALGQLLGFACIAATSAAGVQRIVDLTKYLYGPYWILLSLIHLASALLAAAFIIRNLKKQVYPLSARRSDLILDKEAAL